MPLLNRLISVNLTMTNCRLAGAESARQMLDILGEAGCEYFFGRSPDPHPERHIRQGSLIAGVSFTHPLLKPRAGAARVRRLPDLRGWAFCCGVGGRP
jgi:hypothetical protein